jgi:hypothetical protein
VKPKNKWQRDFGHSQENEGYGCGFVCVCLDIHLHDTLHHTIAFINIHLDIHRVIIIITYTDASALKIKLQQKEKEAVSCFVMYEKKGRCFLPSAKKMLVSFIPKHFIHWWKGKNILQGMDKIHRVKPNS